MNVKSLSLVHMEKGRVYHEIRRIYGVIRG